jgi:SAM-dependent MidA family methyltransferase
VNFSDLKVWGEHSGFKTEGYTNQWAFLGDLDFEDTCLKLYKKIDPFSPGLAAIKSLIMPHGMGASHKVLLQSKQIAVDREIKGFRLKNIKDRL